MRFWTANIPADGLAPQGSAALTLCGAVQALGPLKPLLQGLRCRHAPLPNPRAASPAQNTSRVSESVQLGAGACLLQQKEVQESRESAAEKQVRGRAYAKSP